MAKINMLDSLGQFILISKMAFNVYIMCAHHLPIQPCMVRHDIASVHVCVCILPHGRLVHSLLIGLTLKTNLSILATTHTAGNNVGLKLQHTMPKTMNALFYTALF